MAFSKTNFVDNQTVIDADTLNAIQDELIRVAEEVDATPSHLESTPEKIPVFGATGKVYWRSTEELKADMHADYTVNEEIVYKQVWVGTPMQFGNEIKQNMANVFVQDPNGALYTIAVDNSGNLSAKAFTQ